MNLLLLLGFVLIFALLGSDVKKPKAVSATKSTIQTVDTIDFTNQIHPILVKHCSPCHFTGGKMYGRLPFDKDTTITHHEKGILKRIKGDDNTLIKAFIARQTKH